MNVWMAGFIVYLKAIDWNQIIPWEEYSPSFVGQNLGNWKDAKNKISNIWMIMCGKE